MSAIPMFPTFIMQTWSATPPNSVYLRSQESLNDQGIEAAAPHSGSTISRLVDLLDEAGADDYGLIGPEQQAFRSAYKIIDGAEKQLVFIINGSPCVDSTGGIRVTWRNRNREVRLVCPASRSEGIYVYQESEGGPQVVHNVTPEVLAGKLYWLISGADQL